MSEFPLTVAQYREAYASGALTPIEAVREVYRRIAALADPAVFLTLRPEAEVAAEARDLPAGPLHGIPVAVKDNIDVAGLPTTCACPDYARPATQDAGVVMRLRQAGALIIGKTNLDQFATGLVGMRSPYGVPRNTLDPALVPGGSSSGSAVAVAAGLVPLALGTDTAGSGRVPAGLNNIVGLKPTLGALSTRGVVPACRTLDCVSIFALTAADAFEGVSALAGFDAADPFSRARSGRAAGAAAAAHRRAGCAEPAICRRRDVGGRLRCRPRRSRGARRDPGAGRSDPVLRRRCAPLRRSVGGRALGGDPGRHRRDPRGAAPGHPRHHGTCDRLLGRRRLRGPLSAGGAAPRHRAGLAGHRCALRADLPAAADRRGAGGRPDRPQRRARHLHQLRQPPRSLRPGDPEPSPRRRLAGRSHPDRTGGPRRGADLPRRRPPPRRRLLDGRDRRRAAAGPRAGRAAGGGRRDRAGRGRRASLRLAPQRRADRARWAAPAGGRDHARLPSLRPAGRGPRVVPA